MEKPTKPFAPGDGQIKNWINREGAERGGPQEKLPAEAGGGGCEAAKDKHGGHNIEDFG